MTLTGGYLHHNMQSVPSNKILEMWGETSAQTGVYIHSPFCKEQCDYCTYKGTLFNKDDFARYYDEYLPNMLEFYKDVLSSDKIDNFFFGGGTPSLMTPAIMRDVFNKIPNFKVISKKIFEFHMVDWTKEKLDIIKEYNFNTVIACVQTFDNKVLRKEKRRVPREADSIGKFIEYSLSLGLNVMSDLIYFNTGNTDEDDKRLIDDLDKLALYKTTEITIQVIFGTQWRYVSNVSSIISDFLKNNPEYYADNNLDFDTGEGVIRQKGARLYRKTHDALDVYPQIKTIEGLSTTPHHLVTTDLNTLGIGSFKNHKHTFSKIEDKLEFYEDGDTYQPKWVLAYNKDDYPVSKLIADFYKNLDDNIGDPPDGLIFSFRTETESTDMDTRHKTTVRKLITSLKYDYTSTAIEAYVLKLEGLIPGWNFWKD